MAAPRPERGSRDDDVEGSESLLIELTDVSGRKLTGTGTIVDND